MINTLEKKVIELQNENKNLKEEIISQKNLLEKYDQHYNSLFNLIDSGNIN